MRLMKNNTIPFLVAFLFNSITTQAHGLLHLDPEMTGVEYRILLNQLEKKQGFHQRIIADPLNDILEIGKRNLDWVEKINQHRDNQHKLQLTTPETTTGTPIDAPSLSNRIIILNHLDDLKKKMPQTMADVMFGATALPDKAPVDDKNFIENARIMNHIYESASRWLLQEPYLEIYSQMVFFDVRGYYFLNKETDLIQKLHDWLNLAEPMRNKYSQWLIGECVNSYIIDQAICQNELNEAIQNKEVANFHMKYVINSKAIYDGLFEIYNPRPEAIWNINNPDVMEMPFTLPARQDVEYWLKRNVEDEFKFDNWTLNITFSQRENLAKVEFEAGATPQANGLGGDTIPMDANQSLDEYASNWTIRHEFGHILGFPDCYIEFYDKKNAVMVQYQLDTTNLMCSRRGHFQEQHYLQLRKHYYKQ